MFMINPLKKNLFILVICFLGGSHFAYSSMEISGHFGKKFQDSGAWIFGTDFLYRSSLNENSSFALGARTGALFKPAEANVSANSDEDSVTLQTQGRRINSRLALLTNYRFHIIDHLFIGAIIGIDIWKSLNVKATMSSSGSGTNSNMDITTTSRQFLWNKFTGQFALEAGYMINSNFLVKLEAGYDVFGFNRIKSEGSMNNTSATIERERDIKYNGFYATLGLGYFFG